MDCAPEVMGSCRISHFISSGCFLYICVSVRHRIMEMPRSGAELFFVLMDVVTFNGRVYFEFVLLSRKKKGGKKRRMKLVPHSLRCYDATDDAVQSFFIFFSSVAI